MADDSTTTVPPGENPLGPSDYKSIQKGLAALVQGIKHCEWAEAAQIPCDDLRPDFDYVRQQYDSLKGVFFPGKR